MMLNNGKMNINNIERTCSTNICILLAKKTKWLQNTLIFTIFLLHINITFEM